MPATRNGRQTRSAASQDAAITVLPAKGLLDSDVVAFAVLFRAKRIVQSSSLMMRIRKIVGQVIAAGERGTDLHPVILRVDKVLQDAEQQLQATLNLKHESKQQHQDLEQALHFLPQPVEGSRKKAMAARQPGI